MSAVVVVLQRLLQVPRQATADFVMVALTAPASRQCIVAAHPWAQEMGQESYLGFF